MRTFTSTLLALTLSLVTSVIANAQTIQIKKVGNKTVPASNSTKVTQAKTQTPTPSTTKASTPVDDSIEGFDDSATTAKVNAAASKSASTSTGSVSSMKKSKAAPAADEGGGFGGSVSISRSNSLYVQDDGSEKSSYDFEAMLGYSWRRNWKSSFKTAYSYDLKNDEENDQLSLASVGTSYGGFNSPKDRVFLTPGVAVGIPVNKSQRFASFQGSVGASLRIAPNPVYALSKKLDVSLSLGATRNIHEFKTKEDGSVNSQYSFTQAGSIKWAFTDSLAASAILTHYNSFTYEGEHKEFYSHSQELGYDITKNFSVSAGHSLGAPYMPIRKPNGQDYNLALTDEEQSSVYVSLGASF